MSTYYKGYYVGMSCGRRGQTEGQYWALFVSKKEKRYSPKVNIDIVSLPCLMRIMVKTGLPIRTFG